MNFVLVDRPVKEVAVVTLNRPDRMNAMAFDVMVPFREALVELGHDNVVRAVVLTGAGDGFCSGADQESAGVPPHVDGLTRPTYALRSMELLEDIVLTLRRLHQPVIAAVNGAAIGGGLCLALACDLRLAAPAAYFRAAGINNGLTASELGLSFLLPRAVGSTRAAEIMMTGRDVPAEEAERIGLVSSLHDDVVRRDGTADRDDVTARHRAHQEVAARRDRRLIPRDLPARRGSRSALPAAAHRQLRGSHPRAQGGPRAKVPRRSLRRERNLRARFAHRG
jgi:enoyl-CoA hydratase